MTDQYSVQKEKMAQGATMLQEQDIDLWLILTSEGSDPCLPLITGVQSVGPAAFLFTQSGERYALCSSIDAQDIEESQLFTEVQGYGAGGLAEPLRQWIKKLNPERIALNYSREEPLCDGLTQGRYQWLVETLGSNYEECFVSADVFLTRLRSIKTPEEIRRIQKAVDYTQEIYSEVLQRIRLGMSELEVGQLFIDEMKKRGLVSGGSKALTMPIVMKERIAHRGPGPARLEAGDYLVMDFSVDYEGYVSDIARTAYVLGPGQDQAEEEFLKVFAAAHGAITKAFEAIQPGRKGYEVDQVAREYLLELGMPEITHATGHQLGRQPHDGGVLLGPRWERYGQAPYGVIEENMVFTIEPTIFIENGPAMLVEENIVVTRDGARLLSARQNELILISTT